jgi:REP-associated tyrosine transposase
MLDEPRTSWPHAPLHQLSERGVYFVTAGTHLKHHYFEGDVRLGVLQRGLLSLSQAAGWQLEAWSVFSNHYHFVACSPEAENSAESLKGWLAELHFKTASWVNKLDHARGRKVWQNYRDTVLTFERSYFARLNYVHQNPMKHGLVNDARQYPWCSANWLEKSATPAQVATIQSFKIDRVSVYDDFDPI